MDGHVAREGGAGTAERKSTHHFSAFAKPLSNLPLYHGVTSAFAPRFTGQSDAIRH
jgi:hypothetical protein